MKKMIAKTGSIPLSLALGTGSGLAVSLIGACILAWLISTEKIGHAALNNAVLIILLLSSATAATVSTISAKQKRLLMCVLSGACYLVVLLASTALIFGGQYQGVGVTALAVLAGCMGVCLLGLNTGKRRKTGKYKMKNR